MQLSIEREVYWQLQSQFIAQTYVWLKTSMQLDVPMDILMPLLENTTRKELQYYAIF